MTDPITREERIKRHLQKLSARQWWALLGSTEVHWGANNGISVFDPIITACGGRFSTSHAISGGALLNPDFTINRTNFNSMRNYYESLNTAARCQKCREYREAM